MSWTHPGGTIRGVTTRPGPRPIVDERRFIPGTRDQARQLYESLVQVGVPEHTARSMVGTLMTLPDRYNNALHARVSRYRADLAKVGIPPWEGDRATRSIGGYHKSSKHRRPRYPRPGTAPLALVA